MDNWYMATIRPLDLAGAISDIYIGDNMDAAPTAKPPRNLASTNILISGAIPVPIDVNKNNTAYL